MLSRLFSTDNRNTDVMVIEPPYSAARVQPAERFGAAELDELLTELGPRMALILDADGYPASVESAGDWTAS